MKSLTRWNPLKPSKWDPFAELEEMQTRLDSLFGRAPGRPENGGQESMSVAEWAPLVDITEDAKEFLIKAELPEMKKEDVKVSVENGVLTISGERRFEKEEKDKEKKYHRIERSYGKFIRSFGMPEGSDPGKVAAEFKDGVLTVRLPKSEKAKPTSIDVKVS
jgi:HSP20 family protein